MEWIFVALLGACMGSFVTAASYRLPREEDIVFMPSRCVACGQKLAARDLLPILSWLWTRGRCRFCKTAVHWRYPAIELCCALIFLLLYALYGTTWQAGALMLLAVMLLIMIVADFEHYIIPDEVHWVLAPLALAYHGLILHSDWENILLGGLLGLIVGAGLHYGYSHLRKKEALGFGDVKFLVVAGLWLGLRGMVPFFFYAGLLGIITGLAWRMLGRGPRFPFGPALAMALFVCTVYPPAVYAFWHLQESLLP